MSAACDVYDLPEATGDGGESTTSAGAGGDAGASGAAGAGVGGSAGAGGEGTDDAGEDGTVTGGDGSNPGADAPSDGANRDAEASGGPDGREDAPADVGTECIRESRSAFCLRVGKNCGTVTAADNCGVSTTQDCGLCVLLEGCGGTGTPNVCGAPPNNLAQGGTVTASNPGTGLEDMTKAFDGNGMTKWFVSANRTPWIAYQFAGGASHVVTSYGVASANDIPTRDPASWVLQGSNDGNTWTPLDNRTAQIFPNRLQTNIYSCANTTAYQRYRFLMTANAGSADTQLAEILLFGQ